MEKKNNSVNDRLKVSERRGDLMRKNYSARAEAGLIAKVRTKCIYCDHKNVWVKMSGITCAKCGRNQK